MLALALLASLAFVRLLLVLARRRRTSRLRLQPDGVEASGPDGRGTFDGDLLTGVRCGPGTHLALLAVDGITVELPAAELRSDPQLVARLVEHYRAHPDDRAELTDGRALARVSAGRLTAP